MSRSTVVDVAPDGATDQHLARLRLGRRIGLTALGLFLLAGATNLLGPRSATVSASADGYTLTVSYPAVSREGLPASWIVTVDHPGGFDGPVTLAVTQEYFELFDFHGLSPTPSSETFRDGLWLLEFEPPAGDRLVVRFDGRIEPGIQLPQGAETLLIVDDQAIVGVTYRTRLMP